MGPNRSDRHLTIHTAMKPLAKRSVHPAAAAGSFTRRATSTLLAAAALATAGLPSARAVTAPENSWDPGHSGTIPSSGGSGVWDDTTANWVRYTNGGDTTFLNDSSGNYGTYFTYLQGTAGTVNLNTGSIVTGDVSFSTAGYVLQDAPGTSYVLTTGGFKALIASGTVTVSVPADLTGNFGTVGDLSAQAGGTLAYTGNLTAPNGLLINSFYSSGHYSNGTVILSGNNSVTGSTTIYGGTLELAGTSASAASAASALSGAHLSPAAVQAQALGGSSAAVAINAGGTLLYAASDQLAPATPMTLNGGTFNLGTFSQDRANVLGPLTLSADSAIDFGAGASTGGTVAFADSSEIVWSGKLSIYDFHGTPLFGGGLDQLFFGTNASGLTPAQLADITFYAGGPGSLELGTGDLLSDGELTYTPDLVPEPSAWAMMGLGAGLLGLTLRRRRRARGGRGLVRA